MLKFRSNAPQKAQPLSNKEILIYLLGSLLLLLLLLSISILLLLHRSLLNWSRFLSLGFFLDGHEQTDHSLGHLVSPGGESVLEHLGVNLAFIIVSLESLDNQVIWVVTLSCHLVCEHLDHVVTGAGSTDLTQESIQLTLRHQDTNIVEGTAQVVLVQDSVLVDVHELEAVLVHLDLLSGETALIVLALTHPELLLSH